MPVSRSKSTRRVCFDAIVKGFGVARTRLGARPFASSTRIHRAVTTRGSSRSCPRSAARSAFFCPCSRSATDTPHSRPPSPSGSRPPESTPFGDTMVRCPSRTPDSAAWLVRAPHSTIEEMEPRMKSLRSTIASGHGSLQGPGPATVQVALPDRSFNTLKSDDGVEITGPSSNAT